VAAFDRKIVQAKETLDEVKDREDRCHIVEKELITSAIARPKTASKPKKYQKLRAELQQKALWERC